MDFIECLKTLYEAPLMEDQNINNSGKIKGIFKRYWWVVLIVLLAGISFVAILLLNKDKGEERAEENKIFDSKRNPALDSSLPTCPADTSQLFTKPFMDGDKPDFIIPLGNSNQSGHVVPVDHVYPTDIGYEQDVPVYAPTDITLVWVENKQMHNSDTDEITRADYQLNFAPCKGLNLAFIHLKKLSEKLDQAIEDENSNCNQDQIMEYGVQEGIPTYYITCHPEFTKVRLLAGELIGYFTGQTDRDFSGFDIGLYDFNKPSVGFINPERYYIETNQTVCFADYYIPELREKYYAKLGNYGDFKETGVSKFTPVIGEPKCGKVNHDIAGTLSGNWFKNKIEMENVTDNESLVLIHDNQNTSLAKLSLANVASFTFTPTHSGTLNREYSEITADGKIYCYQMEGMVESYKDKGGKTVYNQVNKYLLQLIDDTHLKVEVQSGICKTNEAFNSPLIYER